MYAGLFASLRVHATDAIENATRSVTLQRPSVYAKETLPTNRTHQSEAEEFITQRSELESVAAVQHSRVFKYYFFSPSCYLFVVVFFFACNMYNNCDTLFMHSNDKVLLMCDWRIAEFYRIHSVVPKARLSVKRKECFLFLSQAVNME